MKISNVRERKAISPIIATVLIIAATLIAFAAIGGYTFGLFGSSTSTANVQVTGSVLPAGAFVITAATNLAQCAGTAPAAPYGTLTLANTGSASATVTSLTVSSGQGVTTTIAATGTCAILGGATLTMYVKVYGLTAATLPTSGSSYTGYVVMNNGAQVTLAGAFQ